MFVDSGKLTCMEEGVLDEPLEENRKSRNSKVACTVLRCVKERRGANCKARPERCFLFLCSSVLAFALFRDRVGLYSGPSGKTSSAAPGATWE